jgi:hypothetical protein
MIVSRIKTANGGCNEMNYKTRTGSGMENILPGSVWLYLLKEWRGEKTSKNRDKNINTNINWIYYTITISYYTIHINM